MVIALDLTGSMAGAIDPVKAEMTILINDLKAASPTTDFRFALVSYEDYPSFYDQDPGNK